MQEIKLKLKGNYAGHNIKASGLTSLNFDFDYTELVHVVPLIQLLNNNIQILAKVKGTKSFRLGYFMLHQIRINNDGSSYVRFNTIIDDIDVGNINKLYGNEIQLMIKGKVNIGGED